MDPLSINQVFGVVRSDGSSLNNVDGVYSELFQDVIRNNWNGLNCSITIGTNLFCNQFTYRLCKLQPVPGTDYWPKVLGHHIVIIKYAKAIVQEYFVRRAQPVYINMSPSMVVAEDGETFFIYSSRGNFACFDQAYMIHDEYTFQNFFNNILPKFNLEQYTADVVKEIDRKYKGWMFPVSMTFHLTRSVHKLYGSNTLYMERGLSERCCKTEAKNDCLWRALSAKFEVEDGQIKKNGCVKKRIEKRRALRIKKNFVRWFKRNNEHLESPIKPGGFDSKGLIYLERFLGQNVNVYKCTLYNATVLYGNSSVPKPVKKGNIVKKNKTFVCERLSTSDYVETTNLLSENCHVRCILDTKTYSGKFVCETCLWSFCEERHLAKHRCNLKERFRCESLVQVKITIGTMIKEVLPKFELKMDRNFCFVTLEKKNEMHTVNVCIKKGEGNMIVVKKQFDTIKECAAYLLTSLNDGVKSILYDRATRNVKFVTSLEEQLEKDFAHASEATFCMDESKLRYNKLMEIKAVVMKYMEFVCCYILTSSLDIMLGENLMFEIFHAMTSKGEKDGLNIRHLKGKMAMISKDGYAIEFKLLNFMSANFMKPVLEDEVQEFDKVVKMFYDDFSLNFVYDFNTTAEMGSLIINSAMSEKERLSFYSPSKELYEDLQKNVKFGILTCKKSIIHEESEFKSGISVDIVKFYGNILGDIKPWTGLPLLYKQMENCDMFYSRVTRSRATYSNLIFQMLDDIMNGSVYFCLYGRELRGGYGYPVDAVYFGKNGEKSILSFNGCLFHPHFTSDGTVCHNFHSNISKEHMALCDVCLSFNKKGDKDYLKPSLYRMKQNETFASQHPIKKGQSYLQVNNESIKNQERVSTSRCYNKHIVITECCVLRFFYKPLSEFTSYLNLPIKSAFEKVTFCQKLEETAQHYFPLLKERKKLSTKTIIEKIKGGDVNGFFNVTCTMGKNGRKNLGIMQPFCYKDDNMKTENSYEVVGKTVASNLLKFLLNYELLSDFKIVKIHYFWEYKKSVDPIYESTRNKIMKLLCTKKDNSVYCKLLKEGMNSAIGRFGFKKSKYSKTLVMGNEDLLSISQLKNLISSTPVNDFMTLMHFKQNCQTHNISHIHCQVLAHGRCIILDVGMMLQYTCDLSIMHLNTDGFEAKSTVMLDKCALENVSPLSFDHFLKKNACNSIIATYILFKKKYFKYPLFCNLHTKEYETHLKNGQLFKPLHCCLNYENMCASSFDLKIEFICDKGIIKNVNRLSFYNSYSKKYFIKSSGQLEHGFKNVGSMSYEDLKEFINK